jgi:glycosyltransferase involved in cell wall biosynthesis
MRAPLHVLLIPSWYSVDSADVYGACLREQAIALAGAGARVGVIDVEQQSLRRWPELRHRQGIHHELDHGVQTFRLFDWNWGLRLRGARRLHFLHLGQRLYRCYVKAHGRPDLFHAHSIFNAGILARRLSAESGIPFVLTEHHSDFGRGRVSVSELRQARLVAEAASDRLAVSQGFAEQMEAALGSPPLSWAVMPNVLGPEFANTPLPKRKKRPFRFISVSYLVEVKRIDLMISAFANAFAGRDDVMLDIAGDGECRPALEKQVRELALEHKVRFLGLLGREEVVAALDDANALVISSEYETFGAVVIEALSRGLPVVSTDCPGPRSIIGEDEGYLVPVDDPESLASAMHRLWSARERFDPVLIRDACLSRYSGPAVAKRLLRIYEQLVAHRP